MSFISSLTDSVPESGLGFARCLFIYIPVVLLATATISGGCIALVEKWAFVDGFYFMVGQICGLTSPLTDVAPITAYGAFCEILFISTEISLAGAVIGIVGAHPITSQVIQLFEGVRQNDTDTAKPSDVTSATTASVVDLASTTEKSSRAVTASFASVQNDQASRGELESRIAELSSLLRES